MFYIDIDECSANTHICPVNETCINNVGSYTCECMTGYEWNDTHCVGKLYPLKM
jgi:hypothetical protein